MLKWTFCYNYQALDKTIEYVYNGIGNIESVTSGENTINFGYTDAANPDRLTSYNNKAITYNANGGVASYDGWNYTWANGKLSKISKTSIGSIARAAVKPITTSTKDYTFTYNALGQRTNSQYTHTWTSGGLSPVQPGDVTGFNRGYTYDHSGRLIRETISTTIHGVGTESSELVYLYDGNSIVGVQYTKGSTSNVYYFQRNLFGDVVAIYDTNGVKVVEYAYDAYGNCTIKSSTANYDLAHANPIRYRGYYYDEDTKLYYLNARYYSPEWRRFISPDNTSYLNPESVNGLNLYCYCNNDPVNYADPSGNAALTIGALLLIGFLSGAAIGATSSVVGQYIANGFSWDNFSVGQLVLDTALGGVSGLLSMSTLGIGAMVAANAGIGFVGAVGGHLINDSDFSKRSTWLDIWLSTGLGALVGRIGGAGALNAGYLNGAKQTAGFIRAAGLYDDVLTKAANGFYRTSGVAANALRLSHYNLVVQWNKMIVKQSANALAKALGYGGIALLIGTAGKGFLYDICNDYF